jgi:fluoride exporter
VTWLVLALAGGLGATCRVLVNHLVTVRLRRPFGIVVVNVSGSFVAGLLVGAAVTGVLPPATSRGALVGFLGAYTTFSTATLDVLGLVDDGERALGVMVAVGTLIGSVGAAALGLRLAG